MKRTHDQLISERAVHEFIDSFISEVDLNNYFENKRLEYLMKKHANEMFKGEENGEDDVAESDR